MDIFFTLLLLHIIWYAPCYLPALERKLAQYLDKQTKPVQAKQSTFVTSNTASTPKPSRGVPYYCDTKFVKLLEI